MGRAWLNGAETLLHGRESCFRAQFQEELFESLRVWENTFGISNCLERLASWRSLEIAFSDWWSWKAWKRVRAVSLVIDTFGYCRINCLDTEFVWKIRSTKFWNSKLSMIVNSIMFDLLGFSRDFTLKVFRKVTRKPWMCFTRMERLTNSVASDNGCVLPACVLGVSERETLQYESTSTICSPCTYVP